MTDIAELRRLLAEATPGPWDTDCDMFDEEDGWAATLLTFERGDLLGMLPTEIGPGPGTSTIARQHIAFKNAALIVAAVNALPALLDELERLRRLAPYVEHMHGCPELQFPLEECTCGLHAARGVHLHAARQPPEPGATPAANPAPPSSRKR